MAQQAPASSPQTGPEGEEPPAAQFDYTKISPPPPLPKGATKIHDMVLLGRQIHLADTAHGQRAVSKGELVNPESVERYLKGKFGEALDQVRAEMERLAAHFPADRLNQEGFHLYEQFRPEVPSDERGWGAKGVLDLARIRALAPR